MRPKVPTSLPALLDIDKTANAVDIPADIKDLPGPLKDYPKESEQPTPTVVTIDTAESLDESLLTGRHHQRVQVPKRARAEMRTTSLDPDTPYPRRYPISPRPNIQK